MRTITLLLCLALAGCAGVSASHDLSADASADGPLATPSGAAAQAQARATKPKSGRSDSDSKDEWWKEGGVTREKINAMCWMKYENGRRDLPVEKRADLVNDCVQKALKEHPLR